MKFFFDNCISPKLVKSLKVIIEFQGVDVIHLHEKYDRANIKDPEWINELSREGDWIIISADPRITRSKAERAAWHSSQLTAFFFSDGFASRTIYEQASLLFKCWPEIMKLSRESRKGAGFLITKSTKIEMLKN